MKNDKQESIISMFDDLSTQYDKFNSYISFGLERYWRKQTTSLAIEYFKSSKIDMLVDVACGTGKMIQSWTKIFTKNGISCKEIIGIDPSSGMLDVAKKNIPNTKFINKKADDMPLEDNSVDVISISYGLRNIIDRESAFIEFNRILKNGGLLVVLEFIKDDSNSILSKIKEGYIKNIIPLYGKIFTGNKDAFIYLGTSIEYMKEGDLRDLFVENGFDLVCLKSFTFGASHTFIAKKANDISKIKKIIKKVNASSNIVKKTSKTKTIKKIDIDISSVLRKVGITLFIDFFEEFNNLKIDDKDIIDLIVKKKKIAPESVKRKVSNARKIIQNNLTKETLEEVLKSTRIKDTIRNKAKKYLKNIN